MPVIPKPLVLIIMDGWGYRENPQNNAIASAKAPTWNRWWRQYAHTLIYASEAAVGLPAKQMGNSEVGHLNIGAGRIVYQEYTRINHAIETGEFFRNEALTEAVDVAVANRKAVHVLGLLSPGGVHSHEEQIYAMLDLAHQRSAPQIYLHAFLDGRDTLPQSAANSIAAAEAKFRMLGRGRIASIVGRYYAMDRDRRWERVKVAYDLLTQAKADYKAVSASEALKLAYARGETDEFVKATVIVPKGAQPAYIQDGDVVVYMNFRADRARELTQALVEKEFNEFKRERVPQIARFVSLTQYRADFPVAVAFPPEPLRNVLGAYLASLGKHQLRVAETEKYAHVTFFFNGGEEKPFAGEDRILVPSPKDVPTYNLKPEMSAPQVTNEIVKAIKSGDYDVIICNYANPDMVGHTGDFPAAVKAIEVLDGCLQRIGDAASAVGGELLITADHGNVEQMWDEEARQPHTAHTTNPVPLLYVGRSAKIAASGSLQDIAPTMLYLMGLKVPVEMTGKPLVMLTA